MKTQMRFQKILAIISVVVGALAVVLALIFCSGIFNQINSVLTYDAVSAGSKRVDGAIALSEATQSFSNTFLTMGIILIVTMVLLIVMGCQKRRNYYVTNYVAIGVVVAYSLIYAILLVVNLISVLGAYNNLNFDNAYYQYYNLGEPRGEWSETPWTVYFGFVVLVLVILNAVAWVLNLVWKIKLMQGEKKLLEQGLVKEVA